MHGDPLRNELSYCVSSEDISLNPRLHKQSCPNRAWFCRSFRLIFACRTWSTLIWEETYGQVSRIFIMDVAKVVINTYAIVCNKFNITLRIKVGIFAYNIFFQFSIVRQMLRVTLQSIMGIILCFQTFEFIIITIVFRISFLHILTQR